MCIYIYVSRQGVTPQTSESLETQLRESQNLHLTRNPSTKNRLLFSRALNQFQKTSPGIPFPATVIH